MAGDKKDRFSHSDYPGAPAREAVSVSPSDTVDLEYVTRALWVGGAGDVKVSMIDGGEVTLAGIPAGTLLPIRVKRVWSTGTTGTSIVALW